MNRIEFQQLADVRIAEATALLGLPSPMPDGAYYLAGYAVECALKACIAKKFAQHEWPDKQFVLDCHTHSLLKLITLANLRSALDADIAAKPIFSQFWDAVKDWNEQARYQRHSLTEAQELIDAIADTRSGVLPWIKARW